MYGLMGNEVSNQMNQSEIDRRRANRMAVVDKYPPQIRELVHEYGLFIVKSFMDCGMKNPARIRHCVETVLNELSPTRGSYSQQGIRTNMQETKEG